MVDLIDGHKLQSMPPLLEKIRGRLSSRAKSVRVVVLGSHGVGKTALLIRCLTDQFFNNYVPGKEMAYKHQMVVGTKKINFDICDSNGKNNAMISYADAVLLVFSVTDKSSFENAKLLVEKVRNLNVNNIPILVVANKIDQCKKRTVTKDDIDSFSRSLDVLVLERSAAIPTEDIASLFTEMYKLIQASKKQRRDSDPTINDPTSKFNLMSIRRLSTSLDENDFIKLVM